MTRGDGRLRCAALMSNGFQCDRQATWWVRRTVEGFANTSPRCANHAMTYRISWPVRSVDPQRDWVAQRMADRDAQGGDS